jgi:Arm DNA-binding domain
MKKMLRYKFTEAVINKLDPPTDRDRYYVHDTVFAGLCLMVTRRHRRTGTFRRTFYLNCCIDSRSRRIRIGEAKNITLVQARKQAKILGGLVESGVDPMEAKREKRREMTLDDLMREYLARHAKPHK